MRHMPPSGMLILLGLSCYQVDLTSGKFRCDRPDSVCPEGLECIAGRCRTPQEAPAGETDLLPGGDLMAGSVQGCTTQGLLLGQDQGRSIYACIGSFFWGGAGWLCAPGHRLCNDKDEKLLALAAAGSLCGDLGGFFAAQVPAAIDRDGKLLCSLPQGNNQVGALVGCGSERQSNSDQVGTIPLMNACHGLKVALPCNGTVQGWSCFMQLQSASHLNVRRGGVLCCSRP